MTPTTSDRPLGRLEPTDWEHVDKYPLRFIATPLEQPVPVVMGTNWYEAFDRPVWTDGKWIVGMDSKNLGRIRGGHSYLLKPHSLKDSKEWWRFYDQGSEGACVGFASSRCMTLLNRKRYDAFWLYHEAQKVDEWPGENYDGTSVRAAMDVLRDKGHVQVYNHHDMPVGFSHGIFENRWAETVDEILEALRSPTYATLGMVPFINSWGTGYPYLTWMPLDTLARVLAESGEAAIVTDR